MSKNFLQTVFLFQHLHYLGWRAILTCSSEFCLYILSSFCKFLVLKLFLLRAGDIHGGHSAIWPWLLTGRLRNISVAGLASSCKALDSDEVIADSQAREESSVLAKVLLSQQNIQLRMWECVILGLFHPNVLISVPNSKAFPIRAPTLI